MFSCGVPIFRFTYVSWFCFEYTALPFRRYGLYAASWQTFIKRKSSHVYPASTHKCLLLLALKLIVLQCDCAKINYLLTFLYYANFIILPNIVSHNVYMYYVNAIFVDTGKVRLDVVQVLCMPELMLCRYGVCQRWCYAGTVYARVDVMQVRCMPELMLCRYCRCTNLCCAGTVYARVDVVHILYMYHTGLYSYCRSHVRKVAM